MPATENDQGVSTLSGGQDAIGKETGHGSEDRVHHPKSGHPPH